MFGSIFGLVGDVAKITIAPVELTASVARAVTKPVADIIEEVVKDITDSIKED